jgi:hypothetical protein
MLKALAKKLRLGELEQFKKCIMKVPILAQCLAAEKARVTSRTVAASAAPSAYTPLLSGEDENKCSQEELYEEIKILNSEGDVPTRELIACYRELHDNREKFIKLNAQIEDSPNKNFYKKICLLLDRLRRQETREQQQLKVNEFKAAAEMAEMKSISEKRDAAAAATAQQQKELEDSLEASRRNLGKDPTDTVALLRKLADLFLKKYEYDRALPLYEECLDISKRVLGEDHPETLKSLKSLANLFELNNNYDRALPLLEELLAKQKRVLGEDDPETLQSLSYLAATYSIHNNIDRALPLYEELLAKQKRVLGENDPKTLASFNMYIQLSEKLRRRVVEQQQKQQAEQQAEQQKQRLEKQRQVLGEDHPETLKSLESLAYIFYRIENYDRALPLYEELLAKQKHVLGDEHPETLSTLKFLAYIEEQRQKKETGASLGGKSKNKRNHKNKSFRSTRRRRYSRARGGKKIAASSSKTIKRRRKNAR